MVTSNDLESAARKDSSLRGIMNDISGVAQRAFPARSPILAEKAVMDFIIEHEPWGMQSFLYGDGSNSQLTPPEYLKLFKKRLEIWAYHAHMESSESDWFAALDGCARIVQRGPQIF